MNAVIRSIGAFIPLKRVTNAELPASLETTDEWIVSHTGIRSRHIAAEEEATSDLAIKAAHAALKKAALSPEELDMILVATATPDFICFPATACIVQDRLGAVNAGAMDIVAGCTGFIYGLETARGYIASGFARNVLVCGAETLTRIANWQDRNTCVLFGDGAGAAVVSGEPDGEPRGILYSHMRAEGSGARLLEVTAGGSRFPHQEGKTPPEDHFLKMNGQQVYNFAVRVIVDTIRLIMEKNSLTIDQIKYIVPHQANIRIIEAAAKRSKVPLEKFYMNIDEYANTSAASIPLALNEMLAKGLIQAGDLILTVGFGAGLTYGGNLIRW